ncbi:MAG: TRAP transporter substrate-binding protein [Spirochaetales bacterium]|nr:TRAP transporter substrate-binding protein [Spirochaetales bacterium]
MGKAIIVRICLLFFAVAVFWGNGKTESDISPLPVVLRLAETHGSDYPTTRGDYEFARLVEERSGGRIRIIVYPDARLGEERAVIEQVQFGAIDFTRVSISPLAAFSENFNALQMPYLYRNADHMWNILNSPLGDDFLDSLSPAGFVGLSWFDSGARSFYNSLRPIRSVDDLKGMKIRVQESSLMVGLVEALGAVATPMPFGLVYSAIQTGVIDGAENNWPSYFSTEHYEVARYFTIDEHTRVPEITIASKLTMDRLSDEDRKIIVEAAKDSMAFQRRVWADYEKEAEAAIVARGNEIHYLQDNSSFRAAMQPLYDELSPELQKIVKEIREIQ